MPSLKRAAALMVISLLVYIGYGLSLARYVPERSNAYLWGVYHVHSALSDGLLPPRGIAKAAKQSNVGLVLLTDHGTPHFEATTYRAELEGVQVVGGSEVAMVDGHLTFFGANKVPLFRLPPHPPDAVEDINEWGGYSVIAYPDDPGLGWSYWDADFRPSGIEVMNMSSILKRTSLPRRVLLFLYFPFSRYYFLTAMTRPSEALLRWDDLLQRGSVSGFLAVNAHGVFRLANVLPVPVPSYSTLFDSLALGIDWRYRRSPLQAIREGDFFCLVRAAGEPQSFEFTAQAGSGSYRSGSLIRGEATLRVSVGTIAQKVRVVLRKDGKVVREVLDAPLEYGPAGMGIYRAEVYLVEHSFLSPEVPWILSNPISVQPSGPSHEEERVPAQWVPDPIDLSSFRVEKDAASVASFKPSRSGGRLRYTLSRFVPGGENRWCALAKRDRLDLSAYSGFYIRAVSDKYLRYFVELRSGDRWYYGSFKLHPGRENLCRVPFEEFYRVGRSREEMPLSEIDSMFISSSNYTSRTGFSSELEIEEMGFY